eukprot:SAG11_NODE_929_length_6503_cov_9.709557_4_plen_165_part_00
MRTSARVLAARRVRRPGPGCGPRRGRAGTLASLARGRRGGPHHCSAGGVARCRVAAGSSTPTSATGCSATCSNSAAALSAARSAPASAPRLCGARPAGGIDCGGRGGRCAGAGVRGDRARGAAGAAGDGGQQGRAQQGGVGVSGGARPRPRRQFGRTLDAVRHA